MSALLDPIADVGRDPRRGGSRHLGDDAESTLREWFAEQARRRGLAVETDANLNLWAWWGDPGPDAVVTGSHLDSVPGGGAYDGPLGVTSALRALDRMTERGVEPRRPLAVVVFAEEEGGRFGLPCLGSRLLTGSLDPDRARGLRDPDGVTLAEATTTIGHDPARLGPDPERLRRIGRFVELHVEQGRALAPRGEALAVGSTIVAHGRWRLSFLGRADHAGTARLDDRRDPMLPAAATVLAAHVPVGMLHVRNPTGVSHAPDEHAEDADVETGAGALADVLEELCR